MVIVKNILFEKENVGNKYLLVLMLFLEVNKNYIGKIVFSINMFLSMFSIKPTRRNIELVKEVLDKFIELDIVYIKNLSDDRKLISSTENITTNTPLFITVNYDERTFRKYNDDFIFHVLDVLHKHTKFTTLVELYLYILSRMFQDSIISNLQEVSISYENIIKNTSVANRRTLSSYIKILEEDNLLNITKGKNEKSGHSYNIYSLPKDLK